MAMSTKRVIYLLLGVNVIKCIVFLGFAFAEGYHLIHDIPYRWQYLLLAFLMVPFCIIAGILESIQFARREEWKGGLPFLSWIALIGVFVSINSEPESLFPLVSFTFAGIVAASLGVYMWQNLRLAQQ